MPPTSDEQIQFLVKVQRLLDEGLFVATYKFALLLSLADLSVERGDDSGAALTLTTDQIAGKSIQYYWRQVIPYPVARGDILRQNTGRPPEIVGFVLDARAQHGDSLALVMNKTTDWNRLSRKVAATVRKMPLWKLQTVGRERVDFLYPNTGTGSMVELRPGVAYCFRKFYALIADLVRGAWVRYVRRQNLSVLGEGTDLNEFLFGTERAVLKAVRPVLTEVQDRKCFYCSKMLTDANVHVDHFIPWSRYPVDLGHNFVLADSTCNGKKRDRLPACDHLERWVERNRTEGIQITAALRECGIVTDLAVSNRVAHWAYSQAAAVGGLTWLKIDEMVPLNKAWRGLLERTLQAAFKRKEGRVPEGEHPVGSR